jgi:Secretion system C-terminal sorting domain
VFVKVKHIAICVLTFVSAKQIVAQTFLNGNFEINTSSACNYNLPNASFTGFMANSTGYGVSSQLDIMNNSCPYGVPQNGSWMVSLATNAGNTDAFTTMLSAPLVSGNTYSMSFYDRGDPNYPPGVPIRIGISTVAGANGTLVYTGPAPLNGPWSLRSFTFVAPNNGQHVSVSTTGAPLWTFVDNFCLGCAILPIELIEFSGKCNGKGIVLHWTSMSEKNNDYYSVERAEDGINFIQLGNVRGAGTSNIKNTYSFIDDSPSGKQVQYRIKQTDFDQSISYSDLISIEPCDIKGELSFEVYPNPVSDLISISIKNYDNRSRLIVSDAVGKIIYDEAVERSYNQFDFLPYENGLYLIQIISSQKTIIKKFIKN